MESGSPTTGLVLSGGGARGAYEAGAVSAITDILRDAGVAHPPIQILSGTSVGAINAAWMAANAHAAGWNTAGLLEKWRSVRMAEYLDVNLGSLTRLLRGASGAEGAKGWSLLKTAALDALVREGIDWQAVHHNIGRGTIRALIVPALQIASGITTIFTELAPGVTLVPSRNPSRERIFEPITAEHVLASAAFPFLFPARRVGASYYCDGGLRFNTPIAPVIRCGADRIIVVSLQSRVARTRGIDTLTEAAYPSPVFLAGKLINALLLDPIRYDLEVLAHLNRIVDVIEETLDPPAKARLWEAHRQGRGVPYKHIQTLVLAPGRDVAHMASEHADTVQLRGLSSWFLTRMSHLGSSWEADLLSFLMFDERFVCDLLELGREDTLARRDEVLAFFDL